ncbi:MAG: S-layer homology domain-containing protein, partial [Desulfobacterales bacterium]|nr:S-layer homology domain-containing protein [Desulfobacterales bacterium]
MRKNIKKYFTIWSLLFISIFLTLSPCFAATFVDVLESHWAYEYIEAIYSNGITRGCSQNPLMYCPGQNVTRGQMAAFIIRAKYGENIIYTTDPYFSDVPSNHTFFKYVQRLKDDATTTVIGVYGVDNPVTREQMAAFIIRAKYGENFTYTTTPYFSDVPSDSWAFKYVQKLKDERITTLSGTYLAGSVVTREQMAAFIGRAFLGMGTPSDTPSILDSAVFYKGPRPAPSNVTFINPRGDSVTMLAYPGQVYISVVPRTDVATVQALVNQYGGVILSRIPALGLYLIQVPVGNEGNFISQIRQNPIVLNASPNPLLKLQEYALVDLSDTGKEPNELVVALLSSPDPNARVILAQLDDFVDPHGNNVQAVRESITGIQDSLRVHVGNLPCSLPTALCSSGDQALRGLTAIIAGAEINRQKVDINMSWGVNPATSDPSQFSTTNGAGANSWAVNEWEVYFRQTLDTLLASDWVKNGNVILNKSADNGAVLRDANGNVLDRVGIDITDAINRLRNDSRYGSIMNDVVTIYGAVNPDGTLASYSNLGPSVIYDIPPS